MPVAFKPPPLSPAPMSLDVVAAARKLVAIDSRSSVSDRPVVDFLAPLCAQAGLTTTLQEEVRDGQRQYNLLAWRGEPRCDALLLTTHLDTVPPGDPALWTRTGGDPFALTLHEGRLYGLGAADVKIDFLCKLAALERLREEPLQRPVLLAGTYGEETGRWGAKLLVASLRPLPALALVGEPSGLRPTPAHKGYVEFRVTAEAPARPPSPLPLWSLTFTGRAAHSSQPHVGASANDACLDLLSDLAGRRSGEQTVEVVGIEGGDLVNKVAASCRLVLCAAERPDVSRVGEVAVEVSPLAPDARVHEPLTSPDLTALLLRVRAATRRLDNELRAEVAEGFEPPWSTVNNGLLRLAAGRLEYVIDVRSVPAGSTSAGRQAPFSTSTSSDSGRAARRAHARSRSGASSSRRPSSRQTTQRPWRRSPRRCVRSACPPTVNSRAARPRRRYTREPERTWSSSDRARRRATSTARTSTCRWRSSKPRSTCTPACSLGCAAKAGRPPHTKAGSRRGIRFVEQTTRPPSTLVSRPPSPAETAEHADGRLSWGRDSRDGDGDRPGASAGGHRRESVRDTHP